MSVHTLNTTQRIPTDIESVWDFISSPKNLKEITPDYMGFEIIGNSPEKMYPGMLIQYRVSPVLGLKMTWVTEITHVKDKSYFVDEQRFGPYSLWHHKHFIKEIPGGVEMEDIVDYKVPAGFLGRLAHPYLVKPKLDEIFEYRKKALEEKFGVYKNPEQTATTLKQDILA